MRTFSWARLLGALGLILVLLVLGMPLEADYAVVFDHEVYGAEAGIRNTAVRLRHGTPWTTDNYQSFCQEDAVVRTLVATWSRRNPGCELIGIEPICADSYTDPEQGDPTAQDFLIVYQPCSDKAAENKNAPDHTDRSGT
jgi:hypothetical protein